MPQPFNIGECIGFGWTSFKQRPAAYVLTTFVLIVVFAIASVVFGSLRKVGVALSMVLGPVQWICSISVAQRGARSEEPTLNDAFRPFTERQGDYLMVALAMASGVLLCGIGVVVTWFLCIFAAPLALDGRDFKAAVLESKDLVLKYPGEVALLMLACGALNLVGCLACGVGVLVTGPVTSLALVHAYNLITKPSLIAATETPADPPPAI